MKDRSITSAAVRQGQGWNHEALMPVVGGEDVTCLRQSQTGFLAPRGKAAKTPPELNLAFGCLFKRTLGRLDTHLP